MKPSVSDDVSSTHSHEYEHYEDNKLNQSFRKDDGLVQDPSYVMSLDLRAQSPELSIEKVEKTVNTLDLSEGEEEIDLENDLEDYCKESPDRLLPEDSSNVAVAQMGSLYSFGNPNPNRRE
jgi:hypothetical protein